MYGINTKNWTETKLKNEIRLEHTKKEEEKTKIGIIYLKRSDVGIYLYMRALRWWWWGYWWWWTNFFRIIFMFVCNAKIKKPNRQSIAAAAAAIKKGEPNRFWYSTRRVFCAAYASWVEIYLLL